MPMCATYREKPPVTFCAGASLVRTCRVRGAGAACQDLAADYGANMSASFTTFALRSFSLKTWSDCLTISGEYSGRWPRSGMMRDGGCFRQARLAPLTSVNVSLFLPTPKASDMRRGSGRYELARRSPSLPALARFGYISHGSTLCQESETRAVGARICPRFVEAIMGFPAMWTAPGK